MTQTVPKSMRLQIGIFGRTNVGKSSFLNMVAGQDVAVTSEIPGTTTDVVEKSMELLPIGPVVFLDTAGTDDVSALSGKRLAKTKAIFERADVFVLIMEFGVWTEFEEIITREAEARKVPLVRVVNKADLQAPPAGFEPDGLSFLCSSITTAERDTYVDRFKRCLIEALPDEYLQPPPLVGDLITAGGVVMLVVPIDLQAPKGRLILPQVQTIRDALDNDAAIMVVKEREYAHALAMLKPQPRLAVCDSQVVMKMVADTPSDMACTTFSILFARFKGDLVEEARGAVCIDRLRAGDKVLIAEACSHHAAEDDIGRVKIPRWLRQYTGCDLTIDVASGRDYPSALAEYSLIIHCGACMLTRREMLTRLQRAREAGVPVTNYGVAISFLQGVLERVLSPFPAALNAYRDEMNAGTDGGL
ncbi:MAG: [FeFe] hydrogenase H-cluster maturation GTPase HydF [Chitinivibrionales bacterium]|nr:[FeFe] hydrogenase H-cluster maturation GTPase HydF [Chitinivibrionales bacterium]MBD3357135.1 [FeFe] hydrogenase H-cluster maturation GTPase HydF [Chitinivibrionales bacterium]